MAEPAQPAAPMPIPGRTPLRNRAQAREGVNTLGNTYTNLAQVVLNERRGVLPLVYSQSTIRALGIDENQLRELGYTQDDKYGSWVRPMYAQSGTGGYGGSPKSQGKGLLYAGGGKAYKGYQQYGGGGGGGYSDYAAPRQYGSANLPGVSGYASNYRGTPGQMPLVSWRI